VGSLESAERRLSLGLGIARSDRAGFRVWLMKIVDGLLEGLCTVVVAVAGHKCGREFVQGWTDAEVAGRRPLQGHQICRELR
jgi:hypothetical protein